MKNHIFVCFLFSLGLMSICGCARPTSKAIAVTINDYVMSVDEFRDELTHAGYSMDDVEAKKDFLEDWINRKLLLQEAERQGLEKKRMFLKEIERFWEKTLLKNVVDQKSKSLIYEVSVTDDELQKRYDSMIEQALIRGPYDENYDTIKWQLLREKQVAAFQEWLERLRSQAAIEVHNESLGIE